MSPKVSEKFKQGTTQGHLKVYRSKLSTINKKAPDPKDKSGKKTMAVTEEKWTRNDNAIYIIMCWKFKYIAKARHKHTFQQLEGAPSSRKQIIEVPSNQLKHLIKEDSKTTGSSNPDRRPPHLVYTITKEYRKKNKQTKQEYDVQEGTLDIGLKTAGKFIPFPNFGKILIFTAVDKFPEKKNIVIQIPTFRIKQLNYIKQTAYTGIWFKVYEPPISQGVSSTLVAEILPNSRFIHVGNTSDGCATVQGTGQYKKWDKIVK
ncbi:hypothetical protein MNBD_GAMMA12-2204 [hydrothermal vent metagenome]|uniref:Uncharacterized protein n=1 Tax=hydrothermal vent metagenome TaxID=652676 RepID=A0A3B0YMI3_9ZZZZ